MTSTVGFLIKSDSASPCSRAGALVLLGHLPSAGQGSREDLLPSAGGSVLIKLTCPCDPNAASGNQGASAGAGGHLGKDWPLTRWVPWKEMQPACDN